MPEAVKKECAIRRLDTNLIIILIIEHKWNKIEHKPNDSEHKWNKIEHKPNDSEHKRPYSGIST
jgi:hypothetical protein